MKHTALIATLLCALAGPAPAAVPSGPNAVAWLSAEADADIERAFAQAREQRKPVLLYWGAVWCPPCNHLKSTLFNRQDFIERSKSVVPVYLDGDAPGAQKLASRFKVRGYPTMILMDPQGQELTRLPGEIDAPQVLRVLQLGLSGGRPVSAVLADARAGKSLKPAEWQLLAFYSWDTDEDRLVPEAERPGLLAQLAAACPKAERDSAERLLLRALAASNEQHGLRADAATRQRVQALMGQPARARALMDVLVNYPAELAAAAAPTAGADRDALVAAYDRALQALQADATLSRADRLSALIARIDLQRLGQPKDSKAPTLPAALKQQMRDTAALFDRDVKDGNERQTVITAAAHGLARAGLWADSDALLKANLAKSHSPYYLMSQLASNARQQGRTAEAVDWSGQAFERASGGATRLQWGAAYVSTLVDLAPQDSARIEAAAAAMLKEAAGQNAAFHERSARSLQRMSSKLATWNADGSHAAVIGRLRGQLGPVCQALPAADAQRATCDALLKG
ncbi:thioredoxin family protein [Ideonella alba]|uniref:Thioredoxin family protein n=1 Tax=Ideonella alba TaxID=2824118 RepID=A0A941BM96_9BURK|nr:thioredoxin family protein [Ideonella alba]MBQ0932029.1 thioredoxin family protein [Ideonella alba]